MLSDDQVEYARNAILIAYQGETDNHKKCRATINALCDQAKAANAIVEELSAIGDVLCRLNHYRNAPDSHPVMSWDDKPLTIGTLRKALALRGEAR